MANNLEPPIPPNFSQMMEDLDTLSSDETLMKVFQFEQIAEQYGTDSTTVSNGDTQEQTCLLIEKFLARLQTLRRVDATLTAESDSTHDQLETKLKNIIEQLEMCQNKLQTNSFSNVR